MNMGWGGGPGEREKNGGITTGSTALAFLFSNSLIQHAHLFAIVGQHGWPDWKDYFHFGLEKKRL